MGLNSRTGESWGRLSRPEVAGVRRLHWRDDPLPIEPEERVLAWGLGRSYGDSCMNQGGVLLETAGLDHFIGLDQEHGTLECEAGVTLEDVLELVVPHGWFLAVTPGTRYVTVGGAIANDVHGKNHHRAGTFGSHVASLRLRRSDRETVECSREQNVDLFAATIGGLGLTGLIVSARLQLIRINNPFVLVERVPFGDLKEFFELSTASDADFGYTVAWIDATARGRQRGRGVLIRGNHAPVGAELPTSRRRRLSVPIDLPNLVLNRWSVSLFNAVYRRRQIQRSGPQLEHLEPFFYPLDAITNWNRLYGSRGFFQYQCVIPNSSREALDRVLQAVEQSEEIPFLSVLKMFGAVASPGLLSFPRPGPTLALDFPNRGGGTTDLLHRLDEIVLAAGGAIYPAKDARMSPEAFRRSFASWEQFTGHLDPAFSSSFWRRVNG